MALPALVGLEELERRLGESILEPAERDRAAALLSDASTLVRHEAGRTWVDANGDLVADVPDIAVTVALHAAMRAWYNPASIESQQLGAASVRFGDVWLSAVERDRLNSLGRTTIISVEAEHGFGFHRDVDWWVPVDYGDGVGIPYGDPYPLGY